MRTPFFGPAYVSKSTNLADCQCINLYPEVVETKQGKDVGALFLTPGLTLLTTVGMGPIRGLHVGTQKLDGKLFVTSGSELYSLDNTFKATDLGKIGTSTFTDRTPMIDNGVQLAVFTGNLGYSYSNKRLEPIILPFTDLTARPISAAYQDGFGVINQAKSALWFQSDLNDLTSWDALNFASADSYPDTVVALAASRREMYLIKQNGTEIWYNVGTPGFVFGRNQGVLIEQGTCAPWSVAKSGESLLWLSQSREGLGVVLEVTGYSAKRVSTHGLEYLWSTYSTISDAVAYCYQQDGHNFYVLTFPTGDATWVYDRTESAILGVPIWHQRASLDDDGKFHRHWSNVYVQFNKQHIVGDFRNGNLYLVDPNALLDDQTPRSWLRSWRAAAQPTDTPMRFSSLRLDMETGFPPNGADEPKIQLNWSDDGGHTWSSGQRVSAGQTGETARRVMFRRLGSTRRFSGLDRIFKVSGEALYQTKLIGAELN